VVRVTALLVSAAGCATLALFQGGLAREWGAGGAVVLLVAAVLTRPRPDPERWLRGAEGEAATALILDRLPARTFDVRHDLRLPGSRANIDHLVIGPTGVWAVDTKTTRSAITTGWRSVRFGDRKLDTGPSRWEADVASDLLGVEVRPIVAVHGPGLRARGGRSGGVKVVPAEALRRRLRRGRRRLSRAEIRELSELSRFLFYSGAP
jgi:hypothetical protein